MYKHVHTYMYRYIHVYVNFYVYLYIHIYMCNLPQMCTTFAIKKKADVIV